MTATIVTHSDRRPDLFGSLHSSPCCRAYPSRDAETNIPLCADCAEPYDPATGEPGHAPECECPACETERALDDDADSYFENCED